MNIKFPNENLMWEFSFSTQNSVNISESQLMKMGGGIFNMNETMRAKIPQVSDRPKTLREIRPLTS